jgi:hypothetical protein
MIQAADAAFFVVFGGFVAAFAVLTVITLRWAIRRDRQGREDWLQRRQPGPELSDGQARPAQNGRALNGTRNSSPEAPR